jgi:ATP-dependent DNA ligase
MVARPATKLPTAGPWAFEPKFDGFRAIATADRRRVRLHSRQNRPLTRYFPEIVAAIADQFTGHIVLDGELVVCRTAGLDFMALQRRFTAARRAAIEAPATFLVFDVLAAGSTDLRAHPYRIRRALLLQLLEDAAPPLAVVPMTTDGEAARAWLTGHLDAGIEGVVAKRLDHGYLPARRAWRKVKTRTSAEAVVGGVLGPLTTPVALVLGRHDNAGRLRVAGRTGPLPRDARPVLGALLHPADQRHPWPPVLPPSRFGDAAPVEYTRVEPTVVVELAVDAAVDLVRGRPVWRHPATFWRVRHDLRVKDLR